MYLCAETVGELLGQCAAMIGKGTCIVFFIYPHGDRRPSFCLEVDRSDALEKAVGGGAIVVKYPARRPFLFSR